MKTWLFALTVIVGALIGWQGKTILHDIRQDERLVKIEQALSWLRTDLGNQEERCLRRDAVVDAWLEGLRQQQEDRLDRVVAWLGKALNHGD